MREIVLRDYQAASIEALRENIREGKKNIVLSAPTGSGKTLVCAYLIEECFKKGKRAIFVCDRTSLVQQTSDVFDAYGIPHGVIQADHWRNRPWERVQVASAQTLARRGWPDADLIVNDEAHSMYATALKRISRRDCVTIGPTATPFVKGMGVHYDAVVSVTTTHRLMEEGHLASYRYFAPSEPDMQGVRVVAGEWEEEETSRRALSVVGDCVESYLSHGEGRKFIVFGCNVSHCESLQQQYMAAGIHCALYTYRTGDAERAAMVEEFRKENSYIRGLISVSALCLDEKTEILTRRGWATIEDMREEDLVASFDYRDGAGGKITFAKPKRVIRRALAPHERFVSNLSKHVRIRVTDNHRMLVQRGARRVNAPFRWALRTAGECAGINGLNIPVSGHADPDKIFVAQEVAPDQKRRIRANSYVLRQQGMDAAEARRVATLRIEERQSMRYKNPHELSLDECRLIGFWIGDGSRSKLQTGGVTYTFVQSLRYAEIVAWFDAVISRVGVHSTRRVNPKSQYRKAQYDVVVWNMPRGTGFGSQKREGLYALEPYLQKSGTDLFWGLNEEQYAALLEGLDKADGEHNRTRGVAWRISGTNKALFDLLQAIGVCRGCRVSVTDQSGRPRIAAGHKRLYQLSVRTDRQVTTNAFSCASVEPAGAPERVWCVETELGTIVTRRDGRVTIMGNCKGFDVPDIGVVTLARPLRSSFSEYVQSIGRGLRPHPSKSHCTILDHTGNWDRFGARLEDFFANGANSLDDGSRKEKPKQEKKDKQPVKCPKCACVHSPAPMCANCGYTYPRKSSVHHEAGELREMGGVSVVTRDDRQRLYSELLHIQQTRDYKPGWVAYTFKDRTGAFPSPGLYPVPAEPSAQLLNWLRSQAIRKAKGREKAAKGASLFGAVR